MICESCGCTETRPCIDEERGEPCYWIESGLCSNCAPAPGAPAVPGLPFADEFVPTSPPPYLRRARPRQVA